MAKFKPKQNARVISEQDNVLPSAVIGAVIEISDVDESVDPPLYAFQYQAAGEDDLAEYWVSEEQLDAVGNAEESEAEGE